MAEVGWPSGLRRYVQVVVNNVGAGSNPASTSVFGFLLSNISGSLPG